MADVNKYWLKIESGFQSDFIYCLCYVFEKQLTTAEILMNSGYSKLMASGQQENFFILFQKAC